MKTKILTHFLVVTFLTTTLTAQEAKIWFDGNWTQTDKEKAVYYRPVPKKEKNRFWIVDYYLNGTIQMKGFSFNNIPNEEEFDGLIKYYFESGTIWQEVNYTSGEIDGIRKIYYKSGKLKNKRNYIKDKIEGNFQEFYETGELLERGTYKNNLREGAWKMFYKNGKIKEKGRCKKGEKAGVWKVFYKNVN